MVHIFEYVCDKNMNQITLLSNKINRLIPLFGIQILAVYVWQNNVNLDKRLKLITWLNSVMNRHTVLACDHFVISHIILYSSLEN